ncbi:MAG: hypothetical protein FJ220_05560 [Kiritimatiellaceae bacterium]|nr:hypothetical protein [Kiritimatiellaceae bacterium]
MSTIGFARSLPVLICLFCFVSSTEVFARGGGRGGGGARGGSFARSGSYGSVRQSVGSSRIDRSLRDSATDARDRVSTLPVQRPGQGCIGSRLDRLNDYTCIHFHNVPYYYCGGYYYIQDESSYVLVEPPAESIVYELPDGVSSVTVNGTTYFTDGKTYYRPTYVNGQVAYMVVPAPK